MGKRAFTTSQFPYKITGPFKIHRHEKHFKVSHRKESHKVEVQQGFILVQQDKVGRNLKRRGKRHFLLAVQGWETSSGMWSFPWVSKL
jgi:hypothetical protein